MNLVFKGAAVAALLFAGSMAHATTTQGGGGGGGYGWGTPHYVFGGFDEHRDWHDGCPGGFEHGCGGDEPLQHGGGHDGEGCDPDQPVPSVPLPAAGLLMLGALGGLGALRARRKAG